MSCFAATARPTEDAPRAPAYIDHHCHGIVTDELDRRRLESLFSESHRPHDGGGSQFDKPLGLMIRKHCAPVLGLEPLATPEAYVARRLELGAAEAQPAPDAGGRDGSAAGRHGLSQQQHHRPRGARPHRRLPSARGRADRGGDGGGVAPGGRCGRAGRAVSTDCWRSVPEPPWGSNRSSPIAPASPSTRRDRSHWRRWRRPGNGLPPSPRRQGADRASGPDPPCAVRGTRSLPRAPLSPPAACRLRRSRRAHAAMRSDRVRTLHRDRGAGRRADHAAALLAVRARGWLARGGILQRLLRCRRDLELHGAGCPPGHARGHGDGVRSSSSFTVRTRSASPSCTISAG